MMPFSHIHGYWQTTMGGIPLLISGGAGAALAAGRRYNWARIAVSDSGVVARKVPTGADAGGRP